MSFITDAINEWLEDIIKDAIKLFNKWLVDLMDISLNSQSYMTTSLGLKGVNFDKISSAILKFALALIVLKFIQKGFNIYILQTDGDPDHDPFVLLTGFFESIAISLTFLSLYSPLINIFKSFTTELLKAMGSKGEIQTIKKSLITSLLHGGGVNLLLMAVFIILVIILYVKFIMSGAELLVLKYAIPILSVGLMDSDNGAFGVAVKKFFQVGFTCALQIILLRFAVALLLTLHPIWAIAFTSLAISTPKLIQEFLFMRPGGSGIGGKVQMLTNIKRIIT